MGTSTNVSVYFTMYGILGVDEKAQLLMTYIWLNVLWDNQLVSWDPDQCGAKKVALPRNKFWVPDVVINEFMDENKAPFVPYLYLFSNGRINDASPVKVVSSCNLDIYTFPFDIQNCTLTFNSYLHRIKDIRMVLGRPVEKITSLSKSVMTTMGEWELIDITHHTGSTSYDEESIDELAFHIRVRRRATLYVVNLIIPSCFLITVDLFSFLLPPQSVDRSSFKMTLILGYTVFLLIMNDLLPITGNTIPLINVFFSLCLALMVASLLETILITDLLHSSTRLSPVPRWVRVLVLQFFGCLVCLPWKPSKDTKKAVEAKKQNSPSNEREKVERDPLAEDAALQELRSLGEDLQFLRLHVDQELGKTPSSKEWVQVGFVIDRLLFGLYILFISVSFVTIIIIWVNSYNL
ncbi:5-hydroxytryptamine receptor 3A-like [Periophthalmus magnuspinnatus]|uniref:5-hydroxytryptamine receptor 3A-like n=1 Tax=Periophthalmus magnuspinnatus TaxID=409849 RepID=UPI002437419A|nr:5-hydroxytryptamine receptor 3A-like [Periophthalmus magnuspinnatus]